MADKLDLKQVKAEQTSDDISSNNEKASVKKITKGATSKKYKRSQTCYIMHTL